MLEVYRAAEELQFQAFAARPKDWIDVEGIVIRQSGRLDWTSIFGQLEPLVELKGEPEILTRLAELRSRLDTIR